MKLSLKFSDLIFRIPPRGFETVLLPMMCILFWGERKFLVYHGSRHFQDACLRGAQ